MSLMGITYTVVDKTDNISLINFNEINFLQRSIVRNNGLWMMPMPVRKIKHFIMYWRKTTETKNWSQNQLYTELFVTASLELFYHGKKSFDIEMKTYQYLIDSNNLEILFYDEIMNNYIPGAPLDLSNIFLSDPTYGILSNSQFFPLDIADRQINKTQIGDGEPSTTSQNLTQFVESWTPHMNGANDYSKSLERFFLSKTITLNNSNLTSTSFVRINPVLDLLNEPYIQARLYQAYGIRFDMEIEIRVVATKFHYRQLMGLFRPAITQNEIATYFNNGVSR
ncbi:hypothetical protein A3Q56_06002 [Intoshia linei]|uniref:Uncharacterized protein n=1 Tax=Intoshia linei TaxID=1819745 RepID=A0A177AWB1_9BILA|nr:hypothetical protein A3Q56_06002 [Intoshia linei]